MAADRKIRSRRDHFYFSTDLCNTNLRQESLPCIWSGHDFTSIHLSPSIGNPERRGVLEIKYLSLSGSRIQKWDQEFPPRLEPTKGELRMAPPVVAKCENSHQSHNPALLSHTKTTTLQPSRWTKTIYCLRTRKNTTRKIRDWYHDLQTLQGQLNFGAIIRSRKCDIHNGEKPTKYSCPRKNEKTATIIVNNIFAHA